MLQKLNPLQFSDAHLLRYKRLKSKPQRQIHIFRIQWVCLSKIYPQVLFHNTDNLKN